jgi:DNA-binding NarL/FixJ family response regulator
MLFIADDWDTVTAPPSFPLAWGVVPSDATAEELIAAVGALYHGLIVLHPHIAARLVAAIEPSPASDVEPLVEPLTGREHEVLQLIGQGLANKMIADRLRISEHTVKFHVSAIYAKLGVASRTEAVRAGARRGLIVL